MQDACRVGGGQRRQHVVENRPHLWLRQRSLRDDIGQRPPGQSLHDDVGRSGVLPAVVDGHDVRMVERRGRARLDLEARPIVRALW